MFHAELTLNDLLRSGVCPKQDTANISEYVPLANALKKGMRLNYCDLRLATLFVILRGVRGEEGVEICATELFEHGWDVLSCNDIRIFALHINNIYNESVATKRKMKSYLSHAEGRHSGLSGIHFVRTLLYECEQIHVLHDLGVELCVYWKRAACGSCGSEDLLKCYYIIGKSGLAIYCSVPNGDKKHKVKRLREGSYNTMDYMRSFYNMWELALNHCSIVPCKLFWSAILRTQAKSKSTSLALQHFGLNSFDRVQYVLLSGFAGLNWTTLLVCLCEARQASYALSAEVFYKIVISALDHCRWGLVVSKLTEQIKRKGAIGIDCYCTRLCIELAHVMGIGYGLDAYTTISRTKMKTVYCATKVGLGFESGILCGSNKCSRIK